MLNINNLNLFVINVTRGCDLANHFGVTHRSVQIILPSKISLEKFQVMISERRMFLENDCGTICAAAADKTSKLSKNPKFQSLIAEIIIDGSTEVHITPSEKNSSVDVLGEKALPLPPPIIVAEVFREKLLPKAPPPETVADALQEMYDYHHHHHHHHHQS